MPDETIEPKRTKRPPRKRSPRPTKTGKRSLTRSDAHKRLWQDPAYRAKQVKARGRTAADRRKNPARYSRHGVPDGMRKADAVKAWDAARDDADAFIRTMENAGIVAVVVVPDSDEAKAKAKACLREAAVLALGPTDMRTKTMAINTVLSYTKGKPPQKIDTNTAMDWLRAASRPSA
jgi:hypothetical protein